MKPGRQGSQRAGSARKCSQALRGEREGRRSVTRKRGTGRDRALGGGRRNGGKHLWEPGTGNRMTGASPSRKGGPEAGGRGVRTAQGEEGAHPAAARGRQGEGPHLEGSRTGARLRLRGAGSGSLRPGRSARRVCTARRNGVHISQARGGVRGQRPAASRSPAAPAPTPTSPAGLRPASCGRNPNPRGRWRRRSHLPPRSARRPAVRMRAPGFPDGPPETADAGWAAPPEPLAEVIFAFFPLFPWSRASWASTLRSPNVI